MKTKKVLVPLDDTTFSLQVLPYVTELFDPEHSEIFLLHVEKPPNAVTVDEQVVVYADQATASMKAEGLRTLHPYVRSLEALGFPVTPIVAFGDPAREIQHIADEMNFDVIAMTTHGREGIDRVLHGSVAREVISHANRPVLLYRASSVNGDESTLGH